MSSKTKKPLAAATSQDKVEKAPPAAPKTKAKVMMTKPKKVDAKPTVSPGSSKTATAKAKPTRAKGAAREIDPIGKETVLAFNGTMPKRAAMVQASLKIAETYVSNRQKK